MVPFAPLLIDFAPVLAPLVALALVLTFTSWGRAFIRELVSLFPGVQLVRSIGHWLNVLRRFLLPLRSDSPAQAVGTPAQASAARRIERWNMAILTHAAGAQMQGVSSFLHAAAGLLRDSARAQADHAETVEAALTYLYAHAVPRLAREAIADFRVRVAGESVGLATAVEEIDHSLDLLGERVGALEAAPTGIEGAATTEYVDQSIDRLRTEENAAIDVSAGALYDVIYGIRDTLQRGIDDLRDFLNQRIDLLRDLLAPAAIGAVAVAAVEAFAPNLFCRNTDNVTKKLCGLDEALLAAILATSLSVLVVVDPVAIAKAALAAEEAIEPVIREIAA